jgi:4-aminobutyrate aminotransferase-like enzyme
LPQNYFRFSPTNSPQAYTKNKGVIVTDNAYHGNSFIISQISPLYERKDEEGNLLQAKFLRTVPPPDSYQVPEDYDGSKDLGSFYADKVEEEGGRERRKNQED